MARTTNKAVDPVSLLHAALEGLELQKKRVEEQIREVRRLLGRRNHNSNSIADLRKILDKAMRKRELSDEARERISQAQKRRWREYRKNRSLTANRQG
jgi:hypothetical protein